MTGCCMRVGERNVLRHLSIDVACQVSLRLLLEDIQELPPQQIHRTSILRQWCLPAP
jgi:hypothetical protein